MLWLVQDLHGIKLDLRDPTRFELVCYHSYQWECESEAKRFMVRCTAHLPYNINSDGSIRLINSFCAAKQYLFSPHSALDDWVDVRQVCQALESLGLGRVEPPSITAITPTAKKLPAKPPCMGDFDQIRVSLLHS